MMGRKLALCFGILAACGWSVAAKAEGNAVPSPDLTLEVLEEYAAAPELEGLLPAEELAFGELTEELDAQRRRGPRRPGPRRPGPRRPGWPFPFPFPFPQPTYTCFAQNARGIVFRARGTGTPQRIQRAAMQACRRNSFVPRTCRPLGCRRF